MDRSEAVDQAQGEVNRIKEIERTIAALRRVWYLNPELRLAQLISNALPVGDPYYVTDAELVEYLQKYIGVDIGIRITV